MQDPTAPIALALVPAVAEAIARLAKRAAWVKARPQRWRRVIVRSASIGAGVAVRFGLVALLGWLAWGPGLDATTGPQLLLVAAEGLVEALAPLGWYRWRKAKVSAAA